MVLGGFIGGVGLSVLVEPSKNGGSSSSVSLGRGVGAASTVTMRETEAVLPAVSATV